VTLFANLAPGGAQNEALACIDRFVAGMDLEPGYTASVAGRSKEPGRAGYDFGLAFQLSFIFSYIVLAAPFESFVHPATILLMLPVAVHPALLSVFLSGRKLNIFSALGSGPGAAHPPPRPADRCGDDHPPARPGGPLKPALRAGRNPEAESDSQRAPYFGTIRPSIFTGSKSS